MDNLQQLQEKLTELQNELTEKQEEIDSFDTSDYEEAFIQEYNDMLDECYPKCMDFYPSTILEKCDPLAYSIGLSEYVESLDKSSFSDYVDLENELQEIEEKIEEIETQIEEKEITND